MQLKNTRTRFGLVAISFHWIIALLVISLLVVGLYMTSLSASPQKIKIYGFHKEFGLLVLLLGLLRLGWRCINLTPQLLIPAIERYAAQVTHALLYILLIAMPLSGWLMSSAAGYTPSFFGWEVPNLVAKDNALRHIFSTTHEWIAYSLIVIIIVHSAGALKHHFIDRTDILKRMLP